MLSISNPQKAAQAESYYTEENYYQKNSELGFFRGNALEAIGLERGQVVEQEVYLSLLHGFNPSTLEKLAHNAGDINRRAGIDLTFSAPKSVSTLLEISEANGSTALAEQIRIAHDHAVQRTMQKVEKNYLYTRISLGNNNIQKVKADSMMYASFQHDTSRLLDPQLHTHNFIFSQVIKDDKFNALYNEDLFNNKMYFGQFYRSELAYSLKQLGLTIEITDIQKGLFEIAEVDKDIIVEFSQRSQQIKALEDTYKKKYPEASRSELRSLIAQDSKTAKLKVDRDEVREDNKERAEALGYDASWLEKVESTRLEKVSEPKAVQNLEDLSLEFLNKSIEAITEHQSVFNKEELFKYSLKFGLKYGIRENDILKQVRNSDLVRLDENVYTSDEMIKVEKEIISKMKQSFDTEEVSLENYIDGDLSILDDLTADQAKMVDMIFTTHDKYVAVQGDAGTGKTFALEKIKKLVNDNVELIGLSYTGKAAAGLEEVGIKSHTLHSFLNTKVETAPKKQKVYIVDETGLAGSKQIHKLMQRAEKEKAKIVFIGDVKQFSSIHAGNIFSDMQKFGIQTVELKQTKRQKTEITKSIVAAYNNDTDLALEILEKEDLFTEVANFENRVETAVNKYLNNEDTLIITSKNSERKVINEEVRSKILSDSQDHNFLTKEAKHIPPIDAYFSENYNVNDIVTINDTIPTFKRGQQGKVVSIDTDKNILTIEVQMKHEVQLKTLDLKKHGSKINVHTEAVKPFKEGEKIIFTKNIRNSPIKNGVTGEITQIKDSQIHTKLSNGKFYKFNIDNYNFIDYGYAITDYKAQGVSAKNVLVVADSSMANQNSFYVQVTRAENTLEVITDNKEQLKENIRSKIENVSTLYYTGNKQDFHNRKFNDYDMPIDKKISQDKNHLEYIKTIFQSIKRRLGAHRLNDIQKHIHKPKTYRNEERRKEILTHLSKERTQQTGKER